MEKHNLEQMRIEHSKAKKEQEKRTESFHVKLKPTINNKFEKALKVLNMTKTEFLEYHVNQLIQYYDDELVFQEQELKKEEINL